MGTVSVEQRGHVLVGTCENPPHGLMDEGTVFGLDVLVRRAEEDPGVTAVVLTGAHPERFVAHYDVGEILAGAEASPTVGPGMARASLRAVGALRRVPRAEAALERTPAAGLVALERLADLFLRMNRTGAVFVAAVNGSAMGGGCELALACDARFMADGPFGIGQPEILFGFPPGAGGSQRLARMLGSRRALELVLDGGPLDPHQALEIGVVDEVVPPGELLERAVAYADRLGRRPKAGIAACKRAVYDGGSLPLRDGLRLEQAEFLAAIGTAEAGDAMRAYVEGFERTGELPGYDEGARARALEAGRFTR